MNKKREKRITQEVFNHFIRVIRERTGLIFEERNGYILKQGIKTRLNQTGIDNANEYLEYIESLSRRHEEFQALLSEITINETFFFRNQPHYDILKDHILPELSKKKKKKKDRLRIWSAGCSSGEEPYSVAILIKETLNGLDLEDIDIIASDIDKRALIMAKEAIYKERRMRNMSKSLIQRYFTYMNGLYHLINDVKETVKFEYFNLLEQGKPLLGQQIWNFDIIFCRNVLIYFDLEGQRKALETLYRNLSHDGFLFVGHSESLQYMDVPFVLDRYEDTFFYRKRYLETNKETSYSNSARLLSFKGGEDGTEKNPLQESGHASHIIAGKKSLTNGKNKEQVPEQECDVRRPDVHLKNAGKAFDEERYEDAQQILEGCMRDNRTDSDALLLLGRIHLELGENDKAIEDFIAALEVNPLMVEARFLLGIIYLNVGRMDESLTQLGKAVYTDKNFALAYFYRGRIFETNSDFPRAIKDYETTMSILISQSLDEPVPFIKGITNGVLMELCEKNLQSLKGKNERINR
ncbi:MAG: CheR family methyltransferase [Thermodesulfobacteriota bacterium]|nr:CheR family methyltransferase [Thermodesulfobacteriota bacterium]